MKTAMMLLAAVALMSTNAESDELRSSSPLHRRVESIEATAREQADLISSQRGEIKGLLKQLDEKQSAAARARAFALEARRREFEAGYAALQNEVVALRAGLADGGGGDDRGSHGRALSVLPTHIDLSFELSDVDTCPIGWTCTGLAQVEQEGEGSPSTPPQNLEGSHYLWLGYDGDVGSAISDSFYLPESAATIQFLRAGGADSGSGLYLKRADDDTVICNGENGANTNNFFEMSCAITEGNGGAAVYMACVDAQNSGWGKAWFDDIQFKDSDGNVLFSGDLSDSGAGADDDASPEPLAFSCFATGSAACAITFGANDNSSSTAGLVATASGLQVEDAAVFEDNATFAKDVIVKNVSLPAAVADIAARLEAVEVKWTMHER